MDIARVIWIRTKGGWDAVLDGKVVGHVGLGSATRCWAWQAGTVHGHASKKEDAFRAVARHLET